MKTPKTMKEINEEFDEKFTIEGKGNFIKEDMPDGNFLYADDIKSFYSTQFTSLLGGLEEMIRARQKGRSFNDDKEWAIHYRGYDEALSEVLEEIKNLKS